MKWGVFALVVGAVLVGMVAQRVLTWWAIRCYRQEFERTSTDLIYVEYWFRDELPPPPSR